MKYLILLALAVIPILTHAQSSTSMVFNVYRRDANVISKYNYEFLSTLKNIGEVKRSNDSAYTTTTLTFDKDCINKVTLFITILAEAKDNRTKMSFIANYKLDSDKCPKEGTWEQLEKCDKCKLGISLISDAFQDYRRGLLVKYHDFLKRKKSDKENW